LKQEQIEELMEFYQNMTGQEDVYLAQNENDDEESLKISVEAFIDKLNDLIIQKP
jgi:hypothetical protein